MPNPGEETVEIVDPTGDVVSVTTDPAVEAAVESRAAVDAAVGSKVGDFIEPGGIISESVVKEPKKPKVHKTKAQLEAEVNAARDDLGTTLDELVSKVYDLTPANQAKKYKKLGTHLATQTFADLKGFFAGEGMPRDPQRRKNVELVLKAAGGVAGLIALRAILKGMHKHHQAAAINKAAKKAAKAAAHEATKSAKKSAKKGAKKTVKGTKKLVEHAAGSVGAPTVGDTYNIETGPIIEIDPEVLELLED